MTTATILAAAVLPRLSDAQGLFFEGDQRVQRAPEVCKPLASTNKTERAQWLKDLARGSRPHMVVSVEMAELGMSQVDEKTRWARLTASFEHPVAKHNILFLHYRALSENRLNVQLLHSHLAKFQVKDFQGEVGGATGYLFGLLGESSGYQNAQMILEAYRLAGVAGNYDATVRYANYLLAYAPHKVREKAVIDYIKKVVTDSSDHYIPAMQYRAAMWSGGYFGGDDSLRKYYGDLYASIAALTPSHLSGTIPDRANALEILQTASLVVPAETLDAALAYLRSRGVRHAPPNIQYRMICPWDAIAQPKG